MTKLYVRELDGLAGTENSDSVYAVPADQVADQVVDFTAGVATSNAFNAKTQFVEVAADAGCSILTSAAGTAAAATNWRLPANTPKLIRVPIGGGYKISAISNP